MGIHGEGGGGTREDGKGGGEWVVRREVLEGGLRVGFRRGEGVGGVENESEW